MSGQTDRFQVLRKLPKIRFDEELRGYSRSQVDRVLHSLAPLADEVDDLQGRLNEAETRAASAEARLVSQPDVAEAAAAPVATPATTADFDETLRNTLLLAQRTADQTVKDANAEAERVVAAARSEAADLADAGRRESEEIRTTNDAERSKLEAELADERTRRLEEIASSSADRLAAIEQELEAAHDQQRQQLLADIAELEQRRIDLTGEIDRFESHLAARREAVRAAIAELETVADGDHGLQGEMPPEGADIPATDPAQYAPVAVVSEALGELDDELDAPATTPEPSLADESADEGGLDVEEIFQDDSGEPAAVPQAAAAVEPEPEDDNEPIAPIAAGEAIEAAADETVDDEVETFRADDFVGLADIDAPAEPDPPSATTGIMLGEVDAGPAPDAVGPATEAVDVLQFEAPDEPRTTTDADADADAETAEERRSWDVRRGDLDPPAADAADAVGGFAPQIERPQWADEVPSASEAPTPPSDPFLEELRRVTTEDDNEDDALARFLESDPDEDADRGGGGWFGRRR